MGADLYIQSVYNANKEKFEKAFNELAEARDGLLTRPGHNGVQYPCFYTHAEKEKIAEKLMCALMSVKNGTPEQNKMAAAIEKILEKLNGLKFKDPGYYTLNREKLSAAKLRPIYNAIQKQVSAAHDGMFSAGYFRDSYNDTSVLWRFGLSWWKDVSEPFVSKRTGLMSVRNTKKLLGMIDGKTIEPVTKEWLIEKNVTVDDKSNSPENWNRYFNRKYKNLVKFLKTAIDLKEPIRASL
jgi:hypothetical protein